MTTLTSPNTSTSYLEHSSSKATHSKLYTDPQSPHLYSRRTPPTPSPMTIHLTPNLPYGCWRLCLIPATPFGPNWWHQKSLLKKQQHRRSDHSHLHATTRCRTLRTLNFSHLDMLHYIPPHIQLEHGIFQDTNEDHRCYWRSSLLFHSKKLQSSWLHIMILPFHRIPIGWRAHGSFTEYCSSSQNCRGPENLNLKNWMLKNLQISHTRRYLPQRRNYEFPSITKLFPEIRTINRIRGHAMASNSRASDQIILSNSRPLFLLWFPNWHKKGQDFINFEHRF